MKPNHLGISTFIIAVSCIFFSGCSSPKPQENTINQASPAHSAAEFLANLQTDDKMIPLVIDDQLQAINPRTKEIASLYTFDQDKPARLDLDTFQVSFNHEYILWHIPNQGIIALDLDSGTTENIYQPTSWFNSNPYLSLDPQDKIVRFIDNQGQTQLEYNLSSNTLDQTQVPYPYGTRFMRSPDGTKTIYIAGFGQSNSYPTYLFLDEKEGVVQNFTTRSEIADRDQLVWLPDSSAFLVIENGNNLVRYSYTDQMNSEIFVSTKDDSRFTDLQSIEDLIYAQIVGGDWLVYSSSGELLQTIPYLIAEDLNRPTIIPWTKDILLIEETITDNSVKFKRLWRSDNQGVKQILIPKYYPVETVMPTSISPEDN